MIDRKLIVLGALLSNSAVLNTIGVFTPYWIIDSLGAHRGVVPYDQFAEVWFAAAIFCIYFSFILYCFVNLIYLYSFFLIYKHGYSRSVRKWFKLISNSLGMIVVFTTVALILIGVNISRESSQQDKYTMGYSAWICVASAAMCIVSFIDVVLIIERECR